MQHTKPSDNIGDGQPRSLKTPFYKITIKDQKYEKLKSLKDGLKQYYKSQKINKLKL